MKATKSKNGPKSSKVMRVRESRKNNKKRQKSRSKAEKKLNVPTITTANETNSMPKLV